MIHIVSQSSFHYKKAPIQVESVIFLTMYHGNKRIKRSQYSLKLASNFKQDKFNEENRQFQTANECNGFDVWKTFRVVNCDLLDLVKWQLDKNNWMIKCIWDDNCWCILEQHTVFKHKLMVASKCTRMTHATVSNWYLQLLVYPKFFQESMPWWNSKWWYSMFICTNSYY